MQKDSILKSAQHSIKKWKKHLGFVGWKIDAKITTFNRADGYPQQGDFRMNFSKKRATILLGTNLRWSVEEIVLHELVHIMVWPIDQQAISAIRKLPRQKQAKAEDKFLGELEAVVDQITKSFLRVQN